MRVYERKGHLFGGPYRQAVCLDDSYLLAVSLYIHLNPVKAAHASATPTASGPLPDTIDPTVTIAQPTSAGTYITDQSTITLSGAASDNAGVISVTWTNSRGGSGTASGTTDWTIFAIPLNCGKNNVITVTAKDAANNAGSATLTVDMNPCPVSGLGL